MVYVKIPEPIMLCERVTDASGSSKRPIREMGIVEVIDWLTNDQHFSKPSKMGRVAAEMLADFETKKPGEYVRLTSEQHGHIKTVLDNPSAPMNPAVLKQIVPFIDALLDPLSEEQYSKRAKSEESAAPAS